ncbi:unnamed protein product [Rhizophagus irregularis]|nr:unnamed protein product [Rhizophagus irregularis]
MPYASDNGNLMLPVASHMHSSYGGFHPHFGAGGYPPHAIRYQPEVFSPTTFPPPPPPTYKSELHESHTNPSLINHGGLMPSTSLPSVTPVPVSSQPALSPITSLNGGNSGNEYHMSHHIHQHQTNSNTNAATYHHSPPIEHAQQPLNQEVTNYSSTVTPVSMPSPPASIPPSQSNLRFEILLEAPTAAAQRTDETPMTYLNKGQYYGLCIQDQDKIDGEFTTIIKIMFHDDTHRKLASTYWSFWLTQQNSPKNARAIDIDKAASTGISNVETKSFDRLQFRWHGKKGAKIFIRFSCLSTDFSRIKGVKGIPLRIQVETKSDNGSTCTTLEKSFAKIKLFRDKGAERKNKDDQKHIEKMCEKMRGKTQETTPMIMMYAPPHSVTLFNEMTGTNEVSDDDDVLNLSESLNNLDDVEGGDLIPLPLGKRRRFSMGPDFLEPLDCDPTYIPHLRKKRAELHESHTNPSLINHGGLMPSTSLPSVTPVPVSSQPALSPITSLNGGNSGNEYHMSHHIHQHQTNSNTNAATYHHSPPIEHAQQPLNQEVTNYSSTVTPVSMPSPPASIPPSQSNLRFEILLEAPTAAAQRTDETPMTYLNKGQYYGLCIQDQDKIDGEFTTIIKIMFHDDTHRKLASTYWSFWLTQQNSPKNARAIDIDKAASTGISNVETKSFDRLQFRWHGKKGAKIFIRFSCLSTDFSRIKGVKGIPLRIQVETKSDNGSTCTTLEKSFAKIKLFRDKGAERKNKDDQKHIEKMCEKMRGKTQETTPMIMMYAPPHSVTLFNEMTGTNEVSDDDDVLNLSESLNNLDDVEGGDLIPLPLGKRRRFSMGPDFLEPLDCDPTYIPHLRKKRAVLCIYVKLPGEAAYRAIYLNHLTLQDLISKLSEKLSEKIDLQGQQITSVVRCTKRNLTVRIDDDSIHQLEDETDMEVDVQLNQDGTVQLTLKY